MGESNDAIKTIIEKFKETYDKKYSEILQSIKNFNNYNEQEPQTSTSSNIRKEKNNNNLKLFNFEKLELEPWSVVNLIPNYHYSLQEYKTPCSHLIFVPNITLKNENNQK